METLDLTRLTPEAVTRGGIVFPSPARPVFSLIEEAYYGPRRMHLRLTIVLFRNELVRFEYYTYANGSEISHLYPRKALPVALEPCVLKGFGDPKDLRRRRAGERFAAAYERLIDRLRLLLPADRHEDLYGSGDESYELAML
jgi:hypothetical protein